MAKKQKEKSEQTCREIQAAALQLFLEKGYDETSINEITERAGYAVGSFYRHWESKKQVFMDIWKGYVKEYLLSCLPEAKMVCSRESMAELIVRKAGAFSKNEVTAKLLVTSHVLSAVYEYETTEEGDLLTTEFYSVLRELYPKAGEIQLCSVASILRAVIKAYIMQHSSVLAPRYTIDEESFYRCLLAVIGICAGEMAETA